MKSTCLLLSFVLAAGLSACTSTGVGSGRLAPTATATEQPVQFTWKSTGSSISGSMTATLPDTTFEGRFFEITQQTRVDSLSDLWIGWRSGWYDWPYWGYGGPAPMPATQFITRYSGKVVATLQAPNTLSMRCRFHLIEPAYGMAGGGEGECQVSDGRSVHATFASK
ncbi:MAG: hypothetical protein V4454_14045 [Pseudomonadota bacterium]